MKLSKLIDHATRLFEEHGDLELIVSIAHKVGFPVLDLDVEDIGIQFREAHGLPNQYYIDCKQISFDMATAIRNAYMKETMICYRCGGDGKENDDPCSICKGTGRIKRPAWMERRQCCGKAYMIECVCMYAWRCPLHGDGHVGTHD